jgi:Ca2+-binding EF-hand superfamily protein
VSVLKKAAMNMLVKMVDRDKIRDLKQQFIEVDKDNTGEISAEELKEAIKQADLHLSSD